MRTHQELVSEKHLAQMTLSKVRKELASADLPRMHPKDRWVLQSQERSVWSWLDCLEQRLKED